VPLSKTKVLDEALEILDLNAFTIERLFDFSEDGSVIIFLCLESKWTKIKLDSVRFEKLIQEGNSDQIHQNFNHATLRLVLKRVISNV
jgi:hypothetical protein